MKLYLLFFMLMCIKATYVQLKHIQMGITACSDTDVEYMDGTDGEAAIYTDFGQKITVIAQPPFSDPEEWPGYYEASLVDAEICTENLKLLTEEHKGERVPQAAPQSSIYSRDIVSLSSKSILICHSARFFPPPVHVSWTRNGVNMTEYSKLSQYYPNVDNTYNQFSHISFIPKKGDVYSCTVEHQALRRPDTKTFEVDAHLPSFGPSMLCGVGLTVGLVGLCVGVYFLIKGRRRN